MRNFPLPSRLARTGCSVLALATVFVVGPSPAAAQSFLGVGTATNGGGTTFTNGPGTTTISVTAPQTVINWVPTDNATNNNVPIVFQSVGTTANFFGTGNFAVLNNIAATDLSRVISMNGTITAGALGAAAAANGSIYFYSPSGILLGGSSMINVGSLVLSASPIFVDGNGNFINGASNQVIFGQALRSTASITTSAGTAINANGGDAYVAMVAPRVQHGGTINVSGSAALVGAEAATINFSPDGLFDIQVTTGTTDSQGVSVNGDITGSASTGAADARRAILVAVPKNTALTLAIGSGADLGFAIAGAANVSGNAVILSAGHDIVDGEAGFVSSAAGALANIGANAMNATSGVRATATNNIFVSANAGQSSSFASDLSVRGPNQAWVTAQGTGGTLTVGRDLFLNSDRSATVAGGSATGGYAALYTDSGGVITVNRDAILTAHGNGGNSSTAGIAGGTGTGGTAILLTQNQGGTINVLGNALVTADGTGGSGLVAGANGGFGRGGGVSLSTSTPSGTMSIGGNATLSSRGFAGSPLGCIGCIGGEGIGGSASIFFQGSSSLIVTGLLRVTTDGFGGTGATGRGGSVSVSTTGGSTLSAGSLNASADGIGGNDAGAGAGNGTGGSATVRASGAGSSINIANVVTIGTQNQRDFISVEGRGGQTNGGGSGIGGTGTGGTLLIRGEAGGSITLPNIPGSFDVRIMARGYGGNASADGTTGGTGQAGTLSLSLDAASLTAGPLHLSAAGLGGNAVGSGNITGGNGVGGSRTISVINGSTLTAATPAGVAGGGGGNGSGTGAGGNASGGLASLLVDNSTANFTSRSIIITQNVGGEGATGGSGSGGNTNVTIRNGGIVNVANDPLSVDDLLIGSNSFGGFGASATGNGGNAVAGNTTLALQGGTINLTGGIRVGAQAFGGFAVVGGNGGNATGGNVTLIATGTNSQITGPGAAIFSTSASGGGSEFGTGGTATGGTTSIRAQGGTGLTIQGTLTASADATGGSSDSGNGGLGDGGVAAISSFGGGTIIFNDDVLLSTSATGGSTASGIGGNALGGQTLMVAGGGTIMVAGDLTLNGSATGGTGASGGNATALAPPLDNEESPIAVALYANNGGSITVDGQSTLNGSAIGGAGTSGNGGNAVAGEADVVVFVGDISLDSLSIDVTARGGNGANGGSGGLGQGGSVDAAFGLNSAPINGSITLGSATFMADGYGGNGGAGINNDFGGDGGVGGAGLGGSIGFTGSAAGGTLNSGPAVLTALGTGGLGGAGGNGDSGTGGDGGSGGNGTGGSIQTGTNSNAASPGSGGGAAFSTLSIDTSAAGGNGGNGGSGGGGNGAGGDGGNATGGGSNFLIRGVLGTADSVTLMANATGGNGGLGSIDGDGDGGDARTGIIAVESKDRFQVPTERGTLIVASIIGSAIATGGNGATAGTSTVVDGSSFRVLNGDATIGSVAITLSGDLIDSTFGPSFISVRDGAAAIGTFSFVTDGTLSIDANNGAMNAGSITLNADNFVPHTANPVPTNLGTYFANSFDIQTGNNFITTAHLDSVATLSIVAPGAIQIGNVTGDNMIVLNAQGAEVDIGNVVAGGGIDIDALAFITTGNISGNGIIDLDAGSSIGTGSILNTGNTSLNAGTSINVGAINSGLGSVSLVTNSSGDISGSIVVSGSIYADSDGDIFLGNLTAPGDIELVAIGNMLIGNALAGESIDLDAGGYIDGGNLTAGDSVYAQAGEYVDLLNISAGLVDQSTAEGADYNVGILAGTTIDTGDIAAFNSIGLGAVGNIYTGSIDAGNIFLALGGSNMSFGTINAEQQAYLADDSMIALGGDPTGGSFNPAPITILTPTPSGGSITLRGPVTTGRFVAGAGTTLTGTTIDSVTSIYTFSGGNTTLTNLDAGLSIFQRSGGIINENDLDAGTYIDIRSAGGLALGDLVAGDYIDLRSNAAIGLGNASSGETINFLTGSTVTGGSMTAGNSVLAEATGAIQLGAITAGITDPSTSPTAEYAARFSSGGAITTGNVNAVGRIGFATPTNLVTGNLSSGAGLLALVGGNMTAGAINASDYVYLANYSMAALGGTFATFNRAPILAQFPAATGGSIAITGPVNTGNFRASAGTTFNAGNITSDTNILIDSGGNMTLGNLVAGLNVNDLESDSDNAIRFNSGGSIVLGNAIARDAIDFDADGSVTGGNLTSGRSVGGSAEGAIILGNLSGGIVDPQGPTDDGFSVGAASATSIAVGNVSGAESVGFATLGSITTGTINAGNDFLVMASGNMSFGAINAGGRVYLADSSMYIDAGGDSETEDEFDPELVFAATPVASGGSITVGAVNAGSFQAAAGTTLTGTTINSNGLLYATSGGNMTLGNLDAGNDVRLTSDGNIATGNITSDDDIALAATGSISTLDIFAYDDVSADAGTTISTDDITGNSIELFADGDITTGDLLTQNFFFGAEAHALIPGTSITVESGGDVDVGAIDALDGVHVSADGTIGAGTIDAETFVELSSGGAMQLQAVTAGASLRLTSGATINGGDLTADTLVRVSGVGAVNVGDIAIDGGIQAADVGPGSPVEVFGASIVTGSISTDGYVGLYTAGDLSVGTINAGHDVIALVGDDASFGAITTPENFFLGGYQMFALVTGGEGFNPGAVFDAEQQSSTGGSATFVGSSSVESFEAYVGEDTTLASLTNVFAEIDTGGLFTLTGALNGNSTVISNDIDIGTNASVNNGSLSRIALISRNASQTLIGDGLDALGQGYRLSDAEADRIHTAFAISADTSYGAAAKMILGDLTIDVGDVSGDEYVYRFETINVRDSNNPSVGSIEIVGDVTFSGLGQFDEVVFDTNLFELDAATGSVNLLGQGTNLSGVLTLFAPRIWVASGDILARLEANPTYAGYIAELNAPAAAQRPEGVLRAGSIDIDAGGEALQSLLVQNTGTTALPAGFLTGTAEIDGEADSELAPASVNLVINGQLITESGTITGLAVRDFLVTEFGTTAFVAGSTINGCPLTGSCSSTPIRIVTPTSADVQLSGDDGLGDGLFGNEGDIDDGESGDGDDQSSPISPPNPLFDSRPLTQSGDVDDPVSGAGNPSLYGSPDDEDEDEDEETKKKAKAKQGDGK